MQVVCKDRPLLRNVLSPHPRAFILDLEMPTFYMSRRHTIKITESHSLAIKLMRMTEHPVAVCSCGTYCLTPCCAWNMWMLWMKYETSFLHYVIFWH